MSPHRIDIEAAVRGRVEHILEDPEDIDVETENLLAVIYGWQQEVATDVRRREEQAREPRCAQGNILKYHTKPCSPGCQYLEPAQRLDRQPGIDRYEETR